MKTNIREMIQSSGGRFFSVTFRKRTNGELRHMTARLGVRKNLVGTGHKFSPKDRDLITVWDSTKKNYRFVPADAVISYRCGSRKFGRQLWV